MYSYKEDQEWKKKANVEWSRLETWKSLISLRQNVFLKHLVVVATSEIRDAYIRKRIAFDRQCKRLRIIPDKVAIELPSIRKESTENGGQFPQLKRAGITERWTHIVHIPKKNGLSQVHTGRWYDAYETMHEWAAKIEVVSGIHVYLDWLERLWFPTDWESFWKEVWMYEERRLESLSAQSGKKRKGNCAYCTSETDVYYKCPQCSGFFCCPECIYKDFWTRTEQFQKTEFPCVACREPVDLSKLGYKKKNQYLDSDADNS